RHYNFVQCGASAIGRFTHKSGHLEQTTQQKDRLAAVSPNSISVLVRVPLSPHSRRSYPGESLPSPTGDAPGPHAFEATVRPFYFTLACTTLLGLPMAALSPKVDIALISC